MSDLILDPIVGINTEMFPFAQHYSMLMVLNDLPLPGNCSESVKFLLTLCFRSRSVEKFPHRCAQQYFDWQFFCFVFVRRLFPLELVGIQAPNGSDDFNACLKRTETASIDDMDLRAAANFTGKFLEGWLEIVLAKENAGQL